MQINVLTVRNDQHALNYFKSIFNSKILYIIAANNWDNVFRCGKFPTGLRKDFKIFVSFLNDCPAAKAAQHQSAFK